MTADHPGRRILVVENETLITMDLESTLLQRGNEVVGPFATVDEALRAVAAERAVAGAILDINLGDEKAFPVADALADRGVPFVFLTGYEREILPARHRDRPAATKPFSARNLTRLLAQAVDREVS